ncbi:MAG: acetate/propionate family kinase [Candidatus Binatia bacterium]
MNVLVVNCGSSSLKFQVIACESRACKKIAKGVIERIGGAAISTFTDLSSGKARRETRVIRDHHEAMNAALGWLKSDIFDSGRAAVGQIDAVGHRVVHGGEQFTAPVLIDDEVIAALEALNELAPLHNPVSLKGIRAARSALGPSIPMVAVFDTSFHHTLPDHAAVYAIPLELSRRHQIRRYGFHGLAHQHSVLRYAELTGTPSEQVNVITFHLGNGSSACAVKEGRSVDTSMGFTPLEGLVMGTRSGDLDPALVSYLAKKESLSLAQVEALLNERSGLFGVSGLSHDVRDLERHAKTDGRCRLAIEIFWYRARKYLGAYLAALGGAQAVIFSGGIGENSPSIREKICGEMAWCGLELDSERNAGLIEEEGLISSDGSRIRAYVIPSDEESLIARANVACLAQKQA